ncbi:hypothetical protein C5167_008434 [Papaver somniferum]|uniref:Uncharacterized protein n=1 Tax=Papaver somniferum TaxID=3469 RepID=A0A4Y7JXI6_PAPSO|nr:hypothetical protein C5167_008434 [Papaver somniferum]
MYSSGNGYSNGFYLDPLLGLFARSKNQSSSVYKCPKVKTSKKKYCQLLQLLCQSIKMVDKYAGEKILLV